MHATSRFLAISAFVLGLSACASVPAPAPLPDTLGRLNDTFSKEKDNSLRVSTFNSLLEKSGLKAELAAAGPLTIFVPSDEAFKTVPQAQLDKLSADPEQLKAVLRYHVLPMKLASTDIQGNSKRKTLQGSDLLIDQAGDMVTVGNDQMKEGAMVQRADVSATNGVAHIIDRVLTPPPAKK